MSVKAGCPFCELKDRVLFENDLAAAVLSDPRKVEGHTLIVPIRHVEKPWEMTEDEIIAVHSLIYKAQKRLIPALGDGCDVRQNYRPFLEQSKYKVDHVHYHVLPRTFEDEHYHVVDRHESELFRDLPDDEKRRVESVLKDD